MLLFEDFNRAPSSYCFFPIASACCSKCDPDLDRLIGDEQPRRRPVFSPLNDACGNQYVDVVVDHRVRPTDPLDQLADALRRRCHQVLYELDPAVGQHLPELVDARASNPQGFV